MSYQMTKGRRRALRRYAPPQRARARAGRSGLSGILDILDPWDIFHTASHPGHENCDAFATNAKAPIFAHADDISKNWNPTGLFAPDDVLKAIKAAQAMMAQASAALDKSQSTMPVDDNPGIGILQNERDLIQKKFVAGLPYIEAAKQAKAESGSVDAPGLKDYILECILAAASAVYASALISCEQPWWTSQFVTVMNALGILRDVVIAMAGVIAKVGEVIIKVPDLALDLMKYGKYALLIGGAYWLIMKMKEHRATHAP